MVHPNLIGHRRRDAFINTELILAEFLRLRIFFLPRIILPVILLGIIAWWIVDGYVEGVALGITFPKGWEQVEVLVQDLVLQRGARAVWLWALLPASIGWMIAGNVVRKLEKISCGR